MFRGKSEGMRGNPGVGGRARVDRMTMRILVREGMFP